MRDLAEAAGDCEQETDEARRTALDRLDETLAWRQRDQQIDRLRQRLNGGHGPAARDIAFAGIDRDQLATEGCGRRAKTWPPSLSLLAEAPRTAIDRGEKRRVRSGDVMARVGSPSIEVQQEIGWSRRIPTRPLSMTAPPLNMQPQQDGGARTPSRSALQAFCRKFSLRQYTEPVEDLSRSVLAKVCQSTQSHRIHRPAMTSIRASEISWSYPSAPALDLNARPFRSARFARTGSIDRPSSCFDPPRRSSEIMSPARISPGS